MSDIRRLCTQLERLRTAEGIAESIAILPSRHADLKVVLQAVRERMQAEDKSGKYVGFDAVADCLDEAAGALEDCYEDESEAMRAEFERERYIDETLDARSREWWEQRA